jgi:hypothetical protein
MASVFLLRLPSALVPRELNADEGQMLSQAMKFLVDPRPWIAVDPDSSGPLNSYLISVFLFMGFKPGFVLVHILACVLICLQILMAYLTLRRLGSVETAAVGAFLPVLFYGLATHTYYLHYVSALLPTLLLMVGFYFFLAWLDEPVEHQTRAQFCLLFVSGLALGTAPWCKLQAAPITCALSLVVMAAIFKERGHSFSLSLRVKELLSFCVGAVLTTCVMLAVLARTGAMKEFWYSYILGNLAAAGPLSLIGGIENFLLLFVVWPFRQPLLVAVLSIGLLVHAYRRGDIRHFFKTRKWTGIGLLAYTGAALFAACRPRYSVGTYGIFLIPPITYLVAAPIRTFPVLTDFKKNRHLRSQMVFGLAFVLIFAAIDGARYANMVKAIRELSRSQLAWNPRIAKDVSRSPEAASNARVGEVKLALAGFLAPRRWVVGDSNERIADAVRDIQKTRPVRSLTIWGWAPGVYVLTGIPPATRDVIGHFVITQGPMQSYFRARFLNDLREKTPDLFIDAVAPDAFMWWGWTENDGYESDPQLRIFIDRNYVLVDELTLVKGAKPIRFFARRESSSQMQ